MTLMAGGEGEGKKPEVGANSPRGSAVLESITAKALRSTIDAGFGNKTDRTTVELDTTYPDDPIALTDAVRNLRETYPRLG